METAILVKTLNKGQVTIPAKLRRKIGIKKNSYLRAYSKGRKVVLEPISLETFGSLEKYIREFTDEEIAEWLELDKLEGETLKKAKKLLKK